VGAIAGGTVAASGALWGAARVTSFDASMAAPHAGQNRASSATARPQEGHFTGEILSNSTVKASG
jgi:hypothetical protein